MSDNGSNLSRRSSSQTSHASTESKKAKTLRGLPKRAGSKTSTSSPRGHDPSLTSFPSFSPEPDVRVEQKESKLPVARTISQKTRERKATLAGLTNGSLSTGQNALFDDSPRPSLDVPGSLHLASDEHIERLITRTGAAKLIRQYAEDLAQRDAEMSKLRARADNRERELKRLLRLADVSSADIEKALMRLEQGDGSETKEQTRNTSTRLDGLMNEAMASDMVLSPTTSINEMGLAMPPPSLPQSPSRSRNQSIKDLPTKMSTVSSRHTSRTSSVASVGNEDLDATLRPRVPSSNTGKLQSIFQPPAQSSSYFLGGKSMKKSKASDEISVRSNQSSKSQSSWTQIFGGKSQASRARASSLEQGATLPQPQSEAESSLAKLTKTKTQPASIRGGTNFSSGSTVRGNTTGRRTPTSSRLSSSPNHSRKESNASNLPLTVELDSVLEPDSLPPTMTMNNTDASGVLTDRFGFVYDQRRRKRQSLSLPKHKRNQLSGAGTAMVRSGSNPPKDPIDRSSTPMSIDEDSQKKSWQDYLKPSISRAAGRPSQLLSHTPSAMAVVTVNTADVEGTITPPRAPGNSASAVTHGLLPSITTVSAAQSSAITAGSGQNATADDEANNDSTPSKLLLDQLNDLHDSLQSERMVKWNEFLRRVRAERVSNADPSSNNAPEAELLDGELIGVASLGRTAKQRSKYNHFKGLVLTGIPVHLRPKVWSEASGASERRIPGYYEDLVMRSEDGTDVDPDIANQIKADIRRTLTDNVFFQTGPGVKRLEEVLRAYSLHNPSIGYCQGMNLITASLLLICATPEDCFWLLVAVIDTILPSGYFSGSLLTARADQIVLREYVAQLLPTLSTKLDDLDVELEACTFHWFLSLYAGVLTGGEALYRIWDIVLTLHSTDATPNFTSESRNLGVDFSALNLSTPATPVTAAADSDTTANNVSGSDAESHDGTSSPFLFQIALSLLFLNQTQIMQLESAAQVYTFINHNMTDHGVSLDSLIRAAEALGGKIKRADVLERRERARKSLGG